MSLIYQAGIHMRSDESLRLASTSESCFPYIRTVYPERNDSSVEYKPSQNTTVKYSEIERNTIWSVVLHREMLNPMYVIAGEASDDGFLFTQWVQSPGTTQSLIIDTRTTTRFFLAMSSQIDLQNHLTRPAVDFHLTQWASGANGILEYVLNIAARSEKRLQNLSYIPPYFLAQGVCNT